jgi:hypothetical protein
MWKRTKSNGFHGSVGKPGNDLAMSISTPAFTSFDANGREGSFLSQPWERVILALVCWFPLALPFVWISGLTLFWVLMITVGWIVSWRRMSDVEWAFALTALALVIGLIVGQVMGLSSDRAMSSIYHIIHWVILLAFMNAGLLLGMAADADGWMAKLSKAALISFVLMVAYMLVMAVIVSAKPGPIVFPSLIVGTFVPGLEMLSGYLTVTVAKINSISSGSEWRLIGYGLWTSEGAYLAVILGLFAMMAAYAKAGLGAIVAIEVGVLFAIAMTGSRTTIVAYMLSMGVWALLLAHYWRLALALSLPLLAGGAIFFFAYGLDYLVGAFHQANEFRAASSGTRFASYRLAFEMTMDQNPLTGLGYTPKIREYIHVPIGSHSSWTSILIRGGFVGVFAFAVVYILLARDLLRSWSYMFKASSRLPASRLIPDIAFSRAVLVTLLWWLTEDLDGPAAGIAFSGLAIGLFVGRQRSHARHWDFGHQKFARGAATPLRWR